MPEITVITNYAGSSSLAAQLLEGARADVFAPADLLQMTKVGNSGLLASSPASLGQNQIVVIAPAENPGAIKEFADLAKPGVGLVLAIPGVPIRTYTDEMIAAAGEDPSLGERVRDRLL